MEQGKVGKDTAPQGRLEECKSACLGLSLPGKLKLAVPDQAAALHVCAQVVVDLGKFDSEEEAARAHDRAAVWCLGLTATTNFPANEWALQVRILAPCLLMAWCCRQCRP